MSIKNENRCEVGIIGLGAMGRNLLLNLADHGYRVVGLDKDESKVQVTMKNAKTRDAIETTQDIKVFLDTLDRPRVVLLLVPAGTVVDQVLDEICPLLTPGDLIIDAGNSHFRDTDRRERKLAGQEIYFFGMGVSGGEAGARNGPSLMPGGSEFAYERIRSILEAVAARVNGEPCVTYLGPGSSGHYVKMVHNGIEYGLMQLVAETYSLMKSGLGLTETECADVYDEWNKAELNSYLLEITSKILRKRDDKTETPLIQVISDVARQTGTGMWTCQEALNLQVPVPTIDAAVAMRDLSTFQDDRKKAGALLAGPMGNVTVDRGLFLKQLRNAYGACFAMTFAQGMALLQKASDTYNYNLHLESVARIWRGGCIIRARFLKTMMSAYHNSPGLSNLFFDPYIGNEVGKRMGGLRSVVQAAVGWGVPVSALGSSLAFYDGYRSEHLPTNLIQAQRDYFGSHRYERTDQAGTFHGNW